MIIGIDLGSTNSLAAAWQDGKAVLIPNALGDFMTPSCVSLDDDGSVLVGRAARERLQTHPERTAANFKRFMGSNKGDRKSTRLNSSHLVISYAVFCLKKKKKKHQPPQIAYSSRLS